MLRGSPSDVEAHAHGAAKHEDAMVWNLLRCLRDMVEAGFCIIGKLENEFVGEIGRYARCLILSLGL